MNESTETVAASTGAFSEYELAAIAEHGIRVAKDLDGRYRDRRKYRINALKNHLITQLRKFVRGRRTDDFNELEILTVQALGQLAAAHLAIEILVAKLSADGSMEEAARIVIQNAGLPAELDPLPDAEMEHVNG